MTDTPRAGLLEVDELSVRYGPLVALRDVSLRVEAGEIVTVIGANGAGKSSLLGAVAGLVPPARGHVRFDGREVTGLPAERMVRLGVALAPEGRRVFPRLTVSDNLRLGAAARRDREAIATDRERVLELFPVLGERLWQSAGTLSGGQQQMLAIGRALMSRPRLLLLDEPSLGLAPLIVQRIFELIRLLREQGTTILLVEQNVHRALDLADRAYVLATGQVELSGTAAEVRASSDVERAYLGVPA